MLEVDVRTEVGALALNASLEVAPGHCVALLGPSGAGKTSLLRAVAGLLRPRAGRIACGGQTWLDRGARIDLAPERRSVGYLFQNYALFPNLSVWRNVAYGMRAVPRARRRGRAEELLGRFGMADRAESAPGELSGGEAQRVALARALAVDPAALLLDEPLSALDARTRARAGRELVTLLAGARAPALLVTHDFAEAALLADAVAVLDEGRIVQQGSPAELAAAPASAFVADLTGSVVLSGTARAGSGGLTAIELEPGVVVHSSDLGEGEVAASIHPWEITLELPGASSSGSAQNRIVARVGSLTPIGNRVRVGLAAAQPLTAELSAGAVTDLGLEPGSEVLATWKATATRLLAG